MQGERNGVVRYTLRGSVTLPDGESAQQLTRGALGVESPRILPAGGFKKTDAEIAVWGTTEVDRGRIFVWLAEGMTNGESFTTSVVLGDLIWTVIGFEFVEVPAGRFVDCLRMEYRVLRSGACTCETSPELVSCDEEIKGIIHFAEGVGPVMVQETWAVVNLDCPQL